MDQQLIFGMPNKTYYVKMMRIKSNSIKEYNRWDLLLATIIAEQEPPNPLGRGN